MKVTKARFRPSPKFCSQCAAELLPPRPGDSAILCPNAAVCGEPPYWGPQSQVVAVVLQPIRTHDGRVGLVYVQHNGKTGWELPAGFNPLGESADECASRECFEEASFAPDNDLAIPVDFETVSEGHGCVFYLFAVLDESELGNFVPNNEKQARKIAFDWHDLNFSTHQQAARDFFAGRFECWPARVPAPS